MYRILVLGMGMFLGYGLQLPQVATKPVGLPEGAQPPHLLDKARKIADTSDWAGGSSCPVYYWIAPGKLLYFRGEMGAWTLSLLDARTGASEALPALSRVYSESGAGLGLVKPSPKGARLLWFGMRGEQATWEVAKLDGTEQQHWVLAVQHGPIMPGVVTVPTASCTAAWTDDNHFAELIFKHVSTDLRSPEARYDLIVKSVDSLETPMHTAPVRWVARWAPTVEAVQTGQSVWEPWSSQLGRADDVILNVSRRVGARWTDATHVVHLPDHANRVCWELSPAGDRIVWYLGSIGSGLLKDWPKVPLGYWVSNLDGSNLHEVGHLRRAPAGISWMWEHFSRPQWTPDGSSLSFVYDRALYVVPVD